jgi:hypothetical protein
MAATVTPGTVAERITLEGRIAAAPETGGCEEEDQPDYKRDGNQQGDEPPDEAECHHGIIVPLSAAPGARAAWRAGGLEASRRLSESAKPSLRMASTARS